METNYKPNSHKYKAEQKAAEGSKKIEKVVKGKVQVKKKSGLTKFTDVFISEDATNVKSYVVMDVLVPAIKKAISDIVTDGIDMILYGETGRSKKRGTSNKITYSKFYDDRHRRDRDHEPSYKSRSAYSYDEINLETRGEAESVLARMDELLDMYGTVSVADLNDLLGISGVYTDNKYGWTNLGRAEAVRARGGGYMLKLPKALPID